MSILNRLKTVFIAPLSRSVPTTKVGSKDSWSIFDPGIDEIFVISAGVGQSITFEQELADRWRAQVVLLDPTPTGVQTMQQLKGLEHIDYMPVGLSTKDGPALFAKPLRAEEGSFSIARPDDEDSLSFECRSLESIMRMHGRKTIDVLKMDIEGFEYSVLSQMLANKIRVRQLCVEIHTRHGSGAQTGSLDAAWLILRLYWAGYRIIFNDAMDFTFCHRSLISRSLRNLV